MTSLETGLLIAGALGVGYLIAKRRQAQTAQAATLAVARQEAVVPQTVIINEAADDRYYPWAPAVVGWNFYGGGRGGRRRGGHGGHHGGGHHGGHH